MRAMMMRLTLFGLLSFSLLRAAEYQATSPAALARVSSSVHPGDSVILTDGIWNDAQLTFRAEGTALKPITLKALHPGRTIISGNSWLRIAGQYIIVRDLVFQACTTERDLVEFRLDPKEGTSKVKKSFSLPLKAHHSRVTNCVFLDCDPADAVKVTRWIAMYGTKNRVDHCLLRGKTTPGAMIAAIAGAESPAHLIDNNQFMLRDRTQGDANETILIGDDGSTGVATNVTVESNLFEGCSGGDEIIANRSSANAIKRNTFRYCEGSISLRAGSDCLVDANYFFGGNQPLSGGVIFTDAGHQISNNYFADLTGSGERAPLSVAVKSETGMPTKGSLVAFNTIVHCVTAFHAASIGEDQQPPTNCAIANNIFVDLEADAFVGVSCLENAQWTGNFLQTSRDGGLPSDGVTVVDLRLQRDANRLWRPKLESPAIKGAKGQWPMIIADIEGQPRGDAKDAGCDQLSDARCENVALTAVESGVGWLTKTPGDHRGERNVSREREVQQ